MKMKKIFAILTAAVLAAGVFTACSSDDDLSAPTDTWVEKDYTYTDESGASSQLTCYFMFTKNGYSNSSLKNVPDASKYNNSSTTIKPGMTVVIVPSAKASGTVTNTIASALSSNQFVCKTFALGDNSVGDDGESDSSGFSFTMSESKWNVFYYANITTFLKNDQLKNPPTPLKTSGYSELSGENLTKYFSWKRLLANYLLGSL